MSAPGLLFFLILFGLSSFSVHALQHAGLEQGIETCNVVEVFSEQGCPHCARAYEFLDHLQQKDPQIIVIARDVHADRRNFERFMNLNHEHSIKRPGVPSFKVCGHFLVGFDPDTTGVVIEEYLGLRPEHGQNHDDKPVDDLDVPVFGKIDPQTLGLFLFTIAIGLVDGFNPCAMWVLLFLLSLLVNLKDRKRILLIAGTFVFVSGLVYFVFMAAWLNLFLFLGFSRALQLVIAAVAIFIGSVHIKDCFAFKRGISLSIPESVKPGLYARARDIIQADNLVAAMIGVCIVAVLVNLMELACTAGLPAMYTQILTARDLNTWQNYGYLLVYNLAYIFDDALMVAIVVYTLRRLKIQERHGRWLKLISGSAILALGLLLLVAPGRLM